MPRHDLTINDALADRRLDRALADHLGRSRAQVETLLAAGLVTLNDRPAALKHKGLRLAAGDRLAVDTDPLTPPPSGGPLIVAVEADDYLVAVKPAGLATHPLAPDQRDTLLNRVVHRRPDILGVGEGELRAGVVHRLDVPTSGLVFFALTDPRYHAARHAFTHHTTDKRYLALVHGRIDQPRDIALDLAVVQHHPARVAVVNDPHENHAPRARHAPHARRCRLAFNPVETFEAATLLDVRLHTGFLHQIRVTLAHLGHAVLGDRTYGRADDPTPRLMLHAHRLTVDEVTAHAPAPHDFEQVLATRRG